MYCEYLLNFTGQHAKSAQVVRLTGCLAHPYPVGVSMVRKNLAQKCDSDV